MLKNHKLFFINIGNYRDLLVQNRPLSAHFWPVNFGHVTGRSQTWSALSIHKHRHCVRISALHVKWFWNYKRFNTFSSQKLRFCLCFFVPQFTITRSRIPKIGTRNALVNFYVESKFKLSRFYRSLVMSKSIFIC